MHDRYENPLISRYASDEMAYCFSDDKKFKTWRKLWIALAESEMELGLMVTKQQVDELKAFADDINYDVAKKREAEVRHDVMSHVYAYGKQCPTASPIIHLGATSCYVGDNTDIIVMMDAVDLVESKLVNTMMYLSKFALEYKDVPTMGFTHYQPAQLTTVGKRAGLWLQDLWMDYNELVHLRSQLRLRGVKGTTGTQASFMTLFDDDEDKIMELEKSVTYKMGYDKSFPVTGQTYPRKLDSMIINMLTGISQSLYKMANDIRLLQNMKEIEEPFGKKQIGSSAMAYKRNPMRTERLCSLARYVISLQSSPQITASTQWFERTLDDSANKRLVMPQAFLAVDSILNIAMNVVDGLVVYKKVIDKHIQAELPFMATETILMEAVKNGGDRQELHEKIRTHSMAAAAVVKTEGKDNDLLYRIADDEDFDLNYEQLLSILDPKKFTGRSASQTELFINEYIKPILDQNKEKLGLVGEMKI